MYRIIIDCKSYDLQSYILSNTSINTKASKDELTEATSWFYISPASKGSIEDLINYCETLYGFTTGSYEDTTYGWIQFIFTPHRSGIGGDSARYGTVLFWRMTVADDPHLYIARRAGHTTTTVRQLI